MRLLIGLIILFLLPSTVIGGVTGKISGKVTDKSTGEPLPGVNIIIEGTQLGAATNVDGKYFIINVPAGKYTVSASIIGYAKITISDLQVVADFTREQDFSLTETSISGEEVRVVAEAPMIQKDQTTPVEIVSDDEIKTLPIRGYGQVLGLQAGVVEYGGGLISIRGGRTSETAYYVDGFSQQDPLTGVSSTAINNNAIDQVTVMTGGFSAEYGRVMSGIVNVITKSGTKDYQGSIEIVNDGISGGWINTPAYGYRIYDFNVSGPLLKRQDKVVFFVSGERRDFVDRFPRALANGKLPHNSLVGWNYQAKLNIQLSRSTKAEIGSVGSNQEDQIYIHSFKYDLKHAPRRQDNNQSAYLRLTRTLGQKSFFKIAANYFYTERYFGDGVHFMDLSKYGRPVLGRQLDEESLFFIGDDPGTLGDEGALYNDFSHRESSYIGSKGDFTSQVNSHHQLQAGYEIQRHTLRLYHHLSPRNVYAGNVRAYQDIDVYGYDNTGQEKINGGLDGAKNPATAAIYVQDKIEYDNLVVNAGLRYDYINPDTKGLKNECEPLGSDSKFGENDLVGSKTIGKISPRLGLSFPTTENSMFYMNYGKFFQQPNLENLYVSYRYLAYKIPVGGYFFPFGNPNLKPEETTSYELGYVQLFSSDLNVRVSVYYKDITNLTQVARIAGSQFFYDSYRNTDFATIKGFDLSMRLRRTKALSGQVSYSISWARGTGSTPTSQRNVAFTGGERPKILAPLDFDQRHKISLSMDYRLGQREGPSLKRWKLLQNTNYSFIISAGSGFPYTPTYVYNEVTLATVTSQPAGPINSYYGPWNWQVDVKVGKRKRLFGLDLNFYVWILNLLNRTNALNVYTSSGNPSTSEWLTTPAGQEFLSRFGENGCKKYLEKEHDPTFFDVPRLVRFGIIVDF